MPGNKYGVYNVFTLIEPDGTVRELDHFYAKSEPMVPQNPLVNPWHWVESQAGTFN